ncbi:hypothetical protein JAAARDRAFT_179126 [Jaapia argillacea MUCL 33604]|uniref:Capsular associated protein n=1 Tax=Jaapia argillacea MUCL 33604 TaxID=933084 RepID=A0A067PRT5_9AGAM|nr:hypothetical protein JAAARDRAFT_179126 [Jaapia argillacea MUCL 33604]
MQRRARKTQAHISPPIQHHFAGMDHEKPLSRLNRKSLGVNNRIWLILSLFFLLVLFTRYVTPHERPSPHRTMDFSNLKPKNYLNATGDEPSPFAFCPVYGEGDELAAKYGPVTLSKTRHHLGSGARVQRLIHKALAGQPVVISIIGGSVSACHGAGDDPLSPSCYPSRFFHWWNSVFPHPASELTNGAMRKSNSAYFGYCNAHHVPENTDLVIIELDADDEPNDDFLATFELLVRSLLLRPDAPAIILLGHFSPQVHETHGFAGPEHWHNMVAQFYDVPHVSIKPIVYSDYITDPTGTTRRYYVDPVLASPGGHEVLADTLIAYLQSQICSAWNAIMGHSTDVLPLLASGSNFKQPTDARGLFGGIGQRKGAASGSEGTEEGDEAGVGKVRILDADSNPVILTQLRVPPTRLTTLPNSGRAYEEIHPFCVSANDLINPLPPSLFYGSGWHAYHPSTGSNSLESTGHYWYSTLPMSKIRIPVQVGAGDIGVYYLRENRQDVGGGLGSQIECWVDDNYGGAVEFGNGADVGEPTPTLQVIDHFVTRGSHYVECQLLGEEGRGVPAFKILGVFTT